MFDELYSQYLDREGITLEGVQGDREIKQLSDKADVEKIHKDNEYLYTLLCSASCIGERGGYAMGFKHAVRILARCFT